VRGSTFHATGTLSVGGRTRRVRETLSVVASKENAGLAETEARRIEAAVRAELGGGVVRKSVATLVAERFESHIGPSDRRILKDFTATFTTRILWDVAAEEIIAFVDRRQRRSTAATRERYISGLCAFLVLKIAAGQYPALPAFVRDQKARNPQRRARRPVVQFRIDLVEAIINAAHPSIAIQLRVEWVCGARVSSVLQGCALGDLDLATMTLTFRDTKNGDDVPVALPESMRQPFLEYLQWRNLQVRRGRVGPGSDQALFLHYKGKPYKPNGGAWGTQNKTAFNAAKRRALETIETDYDDKIAAMSAAGDQAEVDRLRRMKADDLKLLKAITQHWLRHKFATDVGRRDPRAAMNQGGWRDVRSLNGYMISDAEHQRMLVEERGSPGTKLSQRANSKRVK
jgi:site-specific recombinase XerD